MNIRGIEHRRGGDGEVAGAADAGVAGVDKALGGDEIDIAGFDAFDSGEDADAATRGEATEIGLDIGAGGIEDHPRGGSGDHRLGGGAGGDIASGRPDEDIATAESEDAGLADIDILIGEKGDSAAVFGDDPWRGEGVTKDIGGEGDATLRNAQRDGTAGARADIAGAGKDHPWGGGIAEERGDGGEAGVIVASPGEGPASIAECGVEIFQADDGFLFVGKSGGSASGLDFFEIGRVGGGRGFEGGEVEVALAEALGGAGAIGTHHAGEDDEISPRKGKEGVAEIADAGDSQARAVGEVGTCAEIEIVAGEDFEDPGASDLEVTREDAGGEASDRGDFGIADDISEGEVIGERTDRGVFVIGNDVVSRGDDGDIGGADILDVERDIGDVIGGEDLGGLWGEEGESRDVSALGIDADGFGGLRVENRRSVEGAFSFNTGGES